MLVVVGASSCCRRMLLTIKFFGKRSPRLKWLRPLGPICACVVAIVAVVAGNLQDKGIKIVGHIPAGATGGNGGPTLCQGSTFPAGALYSLLGVHGTKRVCTMLHVRALYELTLQL